MLAIGKYLFLSGKHVTRAELKDYEIINDEPNKPIVYMNVPERRKGFLSLRF